MRCSGCGNELPKAGACMVCQRLRKNQKRYGARPKPDYLGGTPHQRNGKSQAPIPYPSHDRLNFKRGSTTKKKTIRAKPSSRSRISRPSRGRSKQWARTRRKAPSGRGVARGASTVPNDRGHAAYPPHLDNTVRVRDLDAVRKGINHFLARLHGEPRLLSDYLRKANLPASTEDNVKANLHLYFNSLIKYWNGWMKQHLAVYHCVVLQRYFALDGKPPTSLADLSRQSGPTTVQLARRIDDAIDLIRANGGPLTMERLAVDIAKKMPSQGV